MSGLKTRLKLFWQINVLEAKLSRTLGKTATSFQPHLWWENASAGNNHLTVLILVNRIPLHLRRPVLLYLKFPYYCPEIAQLRVNNIPPLISPKRLPLVSLTLS